MKDVPLLQELKNKAFSWTVDGTLQIPLDLQSPQLKWVSQNYVTNSLVNNSNQRILYYLMQYDDATLQNELATLAQVAEINIHDGIIMEKVIPLYNCVYFVMRFRDTTVFDLQFIDKIMRDFDFCTRLPLTQVPELSVIQLLNSAWMVRGPIHLKSPLVDTARTT